MFCHVFFTKLITNSWTHAATLLLLLLLQLMMIDDAYDDNDKLIQVSDDIVVRRLLCAAALCEMPDLAFACLQYLVDRLTANNCLYIWLCAVDAEPLFESCPGEEHPALELIGRCREFAGKHFQHIVASREFLTLDAEQVNNDLTNATDVSGVFSKRASYYGHHDTIKCFVINLWHQKFVTADVTAVFVNNQRASYSGTPTRTRF